MQSGSGITDASTDHIVSHLCLSRRTRLLLLSLGDHLGCTVYIFVLDLHWSSRLGLPIALLQSALIKFTSRLPGTSWQYVTKLTHSWEEIA